MRAHVIPVCFLLLSMRLFADKASEVDVKYHKVIDEAVDRGLTYLAGKQQDNGSFGDSCPATVASLCAMAFMAKGNTPGLGPYGDAVNRAIDFVLASQQEGGVLASDGNMYGHNMSTLMLSQASGMTDPERQKRIDEGLSKALKVTLTAQQIKKSPAQQGGWRYQSTSADSDMSHTGWAFMALRSARDAGCAVPKEAIDQGIEFIMRCRNGNGFGYQPGAGASLSLTGAGVLCLELTGRHRDEVTLAGGDFILKSAVGDGHFYYCTYYCSQAMFQLGGKQWEEYAPKLYDALLKRQIPDGSFQPDGNAGVSYATAMATLALTPSYRQLPIYQR